MKQGNSIIAYNCNLKNYAKAMRNNSSQAEIALWSGLKNKQLGIRFVRQKMIGNFIVDLYCKELQLALEVDDTSHDLKDAYDEQRTKSLNRLGIALIRVSNREVLKNREGVIEYIKNYIEGYYKIG